MSIDIEIHLLTISEKASNYDDAKESFAKIYYEFRSFLYNVIIKGIDYKSHREEFAKTITDDVFFYVWENPLKWEFNPKEHTSQYSAFKAYLSTLAHYKKLEFLRKNKSYIENETQIIDDVNNDWLFDLSDEEFEILNEDLLNKRNVIEDALMNIDERKRDIVRVYFQYYEEGKKMRPEIILLMTDMFETTWDNIRQIIVRVKKEIKVSVIKQIKPVKHSN